VSPRPLDMPDAGDLRNQRLMLGAFVRGSLIMRDLVDLPPGWWRVDGGPYARGLAELHGWILAACETVREVRPKVDLPMTLAMLSASGWYAGEVRDGRAVGYLPEMARCAPGRAAALRALDAVLYHAARTREHGQPEAARRATEALREVDRIVMDTAKRRASVLPGLAAAIVAAGGTVPA